MDQIIVHLADGFEEVEAVTIVDVLRRAGLDVIIVSVSGKLLVRGSHHIEIKADALFEDVDYTHGKMIILPGGMPGAKNLNGHEGLRSEILNYNKSNKFLAAICAAPLVFGNLGILTGKRAVCYPGFEAQLAGAEISDAPYMVDEHIITGRGVGAALKFSLEIVRILTGEKQATQLRKNLLVEEEI